MVFEILLKLISGHCGEFCYEFHPLLNTIIELYEEFTYANDFNFVYANKFDLNPGLNKLSYDNDTWIEVELRTVPTVWAGACFVMQDKNQQNQHNDWGSVYVGYNKGMDMLDVPKRFKVYFTPNNEWQNIVADSFYGRQQQLMISTPKESFPLIMGIPNLSRDYHYPLLSKTTLQKSKLEGCIKSERIVEIRKSRNCTESCIPITYSLLFNTSDIKVCQSFEGHFCAFWDIWYYIEDQFMFCYKRSPEKYFSGLKYYDDGFYNYATNVINKDRENRTLFNLYWTYQSNLTAIIEEKLVYDSKVT